MSDGITVFTVPAGTRVELSVDGHWLFCEPGLAPYRVTLTSDRWPPIVTVTKAFISPDCIAPDITVGTCPTAHKHKPDGRIRQPE